MDIRKLLLNLRAIPVFALTGALTFPYVAEAVSIGEIALQSRLGEPLRGQIELVVESGEHVENSCLSLAAPDSTEEDTGNYLTKAKLSLKSEGTRQYVSIDSRTPFDYTFAKVRLQIKCPGTSKILKTLTIVPEFAPIDESAIRQISAEERATLLAQLNRWQIELAAIKLQLAQLNAVSSAVAISTTSQFSGAAPSAAPLPTAIPQEDHPKPSSAAKQPDIPQQVNSDQQNGLLIAFVLIVVTLALWQGLRRYTNSKSRVEIKPQREAIPVKIAASNSAPPQKITPSVVATPSPQVRIAPAEIIPAPSVSVPLNASSPESEVISFNSPPPQITGEENTEEDSMVEEAELYASHGRPAKAVEILQEIIKLHPSKASAWPLLLSIYSSLGKAAEFEKTAREFLQHHKDSPSWGNIQALGRTFDKNNPLYVDSSHNSDVPLSPDSTLPVRPVGDILMEMGILSKHELQTYLENFDPKKHGRFGGYLVTLKVITHAQLDQALLQQQGVDNEEKPGNLPSLQDMESFLADFDPKRDGSVSEFLAARNASTPEQLSKLFHSQGVSANTPQTDTPPPFDKEPT